MLVETLMGLNDDAVPDYITFRWAEGKGGFVKPSLLNDFRHGQ